MEASVGAKGKYLSGCFTGEESDLRVFMSFHSLSSSTKDLAYVRYFGKSFFSMLKPGFEGIMLLFQPDFFSIVLCVLKVSKELPAVEPFSLIFRPSIVVLVALGFALLSRFGKAKLCSFYAHGLKDGAEFFSLAKRREIIEAIIGGIIEPGTFDVVFSDLEEIKADDPAKAFGLVAATLDVYVSRSSVSPVLMSNLVDPRPTSSASNRAHAQSLSSSDPGDAPYGAKVCNKAAPHGPGYRAMHALVALTSAIPLPGYHWFQTPVLTDAQSCPSTPPKAAACSTPMHAAPSL
ncbi:hypothetical protein V6N11_009244 [Hibiscus sabdariffa]|uniref:Uncharacterized protein n=1 Tax=Hibiscus sabdariffa TaxID=183260 RepID=A0ABR2PQ26_9ROSI